MSETHSVAEKSNLRTHCAELSLNSVEESYGYTDFGHKFRSVRFIVFRIILDSINIAALKHLPVLLSVSKSIFEVAEAAQNPEIGSGPRIRFVFEEKLQKLIAFQEVGVLCDERSEVVANLLPTEFELF